MGYFTYRLFRDVSLERLQAKTEANLALFESSSKGSQIRVTGYQGDGCAALLMGYMLNEEQALSQLGYQLGGVWMDVRYQDGDAWDLSLMEGAEQRANHSVNPWAHETRVKYNQDHIDHRIQRVCEFWPRQGDVLRPYLLPWRIPVTKLGRTRFVARKGKAYETDHYCYGDADQIHDFMRRFGIHEESRWTEIKHIA